MLPTQIFESAVCLAIAAYCLLRVHGRKRYDGQVFATFLALYALGRFLLEFVRDDDRGGFLGLSTSQLIGIALVGLAGVIHLRRRDKGGSAGSAPMPPPPEDAGSSDGGADVAPSEARA